MDLLFSHRIDKIMLYSDYLENDVITSCIPMVKRAEKKFISAVNVELAKKLGNWFAWDQVIICYVPNCQDR
jgi:hypothetical protein